MSSLPPPRSSLPPPPPPPPEAVDERRWGLGDVATSVGLFFGISLALGVIAYGVTGNEQILEGPWLPLAVGGPPLVQLGHALWVAREKGHGAHNDFGLRFRPSDVAIGAGLCVMGFIGAGVVGTLVLELLDREASSAVADAIEDSSGGDGLTVWIVLMAVIATTLVPLVEELVYRGMLWSALEKRGMGRGATLVVTSLLFALVHFEPVRLPVLFVLGLALGYGRIQTGRIGPCIAGHALINGIGMIFLLIDIA